MKEIKSMTDKITPWCVDPFVNFSHTADGFYRTCCIGTVDRSSIYHTNYMSPIEFFKSDLMNQVRADMITGEFSEVTKFTCRQCILNDKNGVISRRVKQNQSLLNNTKTQKTIEKFRDNAWAEIDIEDLQYVNFKILGNLCNLKCLMCGPSASSKIAAEYKKYNIITNIDKVIQNPFTDSNKQKYFDDLEKIISVIDRFLLVGGEAFINPNFDDIWNVLSTNENSKNINLLIITNGTLIPKKVLNECDKFNNLHLMFSIDGVYNRGSYVRSGLDWKLFDSNVKMAIQSKATISFTVATSMLNIGYLDEIYDYLKELGVNDNQIQWDALVTEPAHLQAVNLPKEIKQMYLEKLETHVAFQKDIRKFNTALDILKNDHANHEEFLRGIRFLKKIDSIRKTKLLDHFPEFEKYYNDK